MNARERGLQILKKAGLLTVFAQEQANIDAIAEAGENAEDVAKALCNLANYGLLTGVLQGQANRAAVVQAGKYAIDVQAALCMSYRDGVLPNDQLGPTIRTAFIRTGEYAHRVEMGLYYLHKKGMLTSDLQGLANIAAIINGGGKYAVDIAKNLFALHEEGMLTNDDQGQAYRDAIAEAGFDPSYVKERLIYEAKEIKAIVNQGLEIIKSAGLITDDSQGQENKSVVIKAGKKAKEVAEALCDLHRAGLLTNDKQGESNRKAVADVDYIPLRVSAKLIAKQQTYSELEKNTNIKSVIYNPRIPLKILLIKAHVSLKDEKSFDSITSITCIPLIMKGEKYTIIISESKEKYSEFFSTKNYTFNIKDKLGNLIHSGIDANNIEQVVHELYRKEINLTQVVKKGEVLKK